MARVQTKRIAEDPSWAFVADVVDRYEERLRDADPPSLSEFLPDESHPLHTRVAAELVRVDLEMSWELEDPKPLESYRSLAPRLFEDSAALAEVAFEEYRLRRLAGESATREEYSLRYGVSTAGWPAVESGGASRAAGGAGPRGAKMPEPGEFFAGFRLTRVLGRGAFATAFLAEQNDLAHRPVVLKVSQRHSLEPEHLARLQHTNIVPIYSVHESRGLLGVCMPYCGDHTLADMLSRGIGSNTTQSTVACVDDETVREPGNPGSPSSRADMASSPALPLRRSIAPDQAVLIVRDLARGLAHAHERGIVHRDLKPANVLMADDGRPMLLDFNLSEGAVGTGAASLTVGGTLPYMAPEHLAAVRSGGEVGPRADIYSLGVILHELLTGVRPFPDRRGQFDAIVWTLIDDRLVRPRPPRRAEPNISPALEALVLKCLEPDPELRYQTAHDLADDLSRHLEHLPLKHAPNPSPRENLSKLRKRYPRVSSASAVGAAAAVLITLLIALGATRARQVARLESDAFFRAFQQDISHARTLLSVPNTDYELLHEGQAQGSELLDRVADSVQGEWRVDPRASLLAPERRVEVFNDIGELAYLLARSKGLLAKAEENSQSALELWRGALALNSLANESLAGSSAGLARQQAEFESALGIRQSVEQTSVGNTATGLIDDYLGAQSIFEESSYAKAASVLVEHCERRPTDPVAWLLLGNAYAGAGQLADAEAALGVAASLQPESYVARYNRGLCRFQRGEHAGAIADFSSVITMRPNLVCARLNRALVRQAAGDLKGALADLDAAIALGTAPARAYLLRAGVRNKLGDAPGANQDRVRGLAAKPTDEAGWVARGVARLEDDPEGARDDFREALRRYPGSILALKNLVHVNADRLRQNDEALAALDAWLAVEPTNANARVGRAVLYGREGRRDLCLRDLEELGNALEPIIAFQAACALSLTADDKNGDIQRALTLLSDAVARYPALGARAATDPDLAALRATDDYRDLVAAQRDLALVRSRLAPSSGPGRR